MKLKYIWIVSIVLGLILSSGIAAADDNDEIPTVDNCCYVFSQGYWKNHPEAWPMEEIVIDDVVDPLTGENKPPLVIPQADAIELMGMPTRGNEVVILFRQYAAARLNDALIEGDPSCCVVRSGLIHDAGVQLYFRLSISPAGPILLGEHFIDIDTGVDQWYWIEPELKDVLEQYNLKKLCDD